MSVKDQVDKSQAAQATRLAALHKAKRSGRLKSGINMAELTWAVQILREGKPWEAVVQALGQSVEPETLESWREHIETRAMEGDKPLIDERPPAPAPKE